MGSGGTVPPFLTSALDGGEWSALRLGRFTPKDRSFWYPLNGRLGGHQNQTGHFGVEDKLLPMQGIEL
jgi:hypothetical protein